MSKTDKKNNHRLTDTNESRDYYDSIPLNHILVALDTYTKEELITLETNLLKGRSLDNRKDIHRTQEYNLLYTKVLLCIRGRYRHLCRTTGIGLSSLPR